jgi:hypothetical protein
MHIRGLLANDGGGVFRAELTGATADAALLGERLAEHLAVDAGYNLQAASR